MNKNTTLSFDAEISLDSIITSAGSAYTTALQIHPRTNRSLHQPVFVVGSPRSGTTVLGKCLGAHSHCASAEESLVLLPLWRMYVDLFAGGLPTGVAHLAEYVNEHELITALGNFSDSVFKGLLQKQGKTTYIDHTPWYGVISPFIKGIYPDARFVHIIRDGRQVVNSLAGSYENGFLWAGQNFEERVILWREMALSTHRFLQNYTDGSVYSTTYRELCTTPGNILNDICNFLDISYEEAMVAPLATHHAASVGQKKFGAETFATLYTPEGWPLDWGEEERVLFTKIAGPAMESLFGKSWSYQVC